MSDPDSHLRPRIEASGAAPQGIRWWLLRSPASGCGLNGPEMFVGAQSRSRRRQLIADMLGPPPPCWDCPDCGSHEHGRPTWGRGSISTSDVVSRDLAQQWLALAVGPLELDIGIDLVAADMPPIAGRTMARFLTPAELRLTDQVGMARMWARKESLAKARGTGLLGRPLAGMPDGPFDTLAGDVRLVDLDFGAELSVQLFASLAWIPASLDRAPLARSADDSPAFG